MRDFPRPLPLPISTDDTWAVVKTLHPRNYNDVYYIGDYFRRGNAVLMNLTSLANDEARRVVDFAAGLVLGRGGDIDRIDTKVFLLRPSGVDRGDG